MSALKEPINTGLNPPYKCQINARSRAGSKTQVPRPLTEEILQLVQDQHYDPI